MPGILCFWAWRTTGKSASAERTAARVRGMAIVLLRVAWSACSIGNHAAWRQGSGVKSDAKFEERRQRRRRAFEGRRRQDGACFQNDGERVDGLELNWLVHREDSCRCGRLVMDGAAGGHRLVRRGMSGAVGGRSLCVTAHRYARRRTDEHRQ